MSEISKIVGERIRNYRIKLELSQEQLAEKCGLHHTYIGQLERGEKNATLESIEKVVIGLGISYEMLFEKIIISEMNTNVAAECYTVIEALNEKSQIKMLELIKNVIEFKNI